MSSVISPDVPIKKELYRFTEKAIKKLQEAFKQMKRLSVSLTIFKVQKKRKETSALSMVEMKCEGVKKGLIDMISLEGNCVFIEIKKHIPFDSAI